MARTRSVVLLVLFTLFLSFSCNGVFGNRVRNAYFNIVFNIQVIPPSQPKGSIDQKSSPQFNPSNFWLNGKGCPDGLVPIRRTTKDDLKRAKLATEIHASKYNPLTTDKHGTHYAIVGTTDTNAKYHGGYAIISVYQPTVVGTQYSSARIKVNPTLYKDNRTRLYTFTKDAANGNWRLKVDNDARELGFWPKNIFTALGDGANYVEWGGEVYGPPDLPSPPMGSGSSILETTRYDAYCRLIKTFNETDYAVNAVGTKAFADVNQYQVKDEGDTGEAYFQHLVLFGGPGGYTGP
ncbi:hypothetical protein CFP56_016347 [Quercus suber]|uniref:Neprosin PEP catalytic domain-containing protein n=1 Tax=Quercus suber TaxID=58331 RepID=A0AAW0KQE2_QUESU